MYSHEDHMKAVMLYIKHDFRSADTIRELGYSSRVTLREWIDRLAPGKRRANMRRNSGAHVSSEQKEDAVIRLRTREGAANSAEKPNAGLRRIPLRAQR